MSQYKITTSNMYQNQLNQVTWNYQIVTDRIILPDSKELLVVDVSLPGGKNAVSDEFKRMVKYEDYIGK
jgi:hypothetical protein